MVFSLKLCKLYFSARSLRNDFDHWKEKVKESVVMKLQILVKELSDGGAMFEKLFGSQTTACCETTLYYFLREKDTSVKSFPKDY